MLKPTIAIHGIRHHGPGSARSLLRALDDRRPDCVLVEGPADAQEAIPLAADEGMTPPVALLVYVPDEPRRSAFYPFAEFSPEWVAMRWALANGAEVRFMDLPQANRLAVEEGVEEGGVEEKAPHLEEDFRRYLDALALRRDPLLHLARAAGFDDSERWWDHLVESRTGGDAELFDAIREAMAALRDTLPKEQTVYEAEWDDRREAFMRRTLRAAVKEGFELIAVVCGAWHAPALDPARWPAVKDDDALLKGLAKVKTDFAWTPWTYGRLASDSGYGAGVVSPAWYELLWREPDLGGRAGTKWMAQVARLMRDSDLDASSASVIEAVRLADALAAMRGRPQAGLDELDEAALSILCAGNDAPMALVRRKLVVGERLGAVPDDAPAPPLQRDLAKLQKSLRLAPSAEVKPLDLDLRKENDLARSHLLHRLRLLGIDWGEPAHATARSAGTFHEYWQLAWRPELAVSVIDAARWGNTVQSAAESRAADAASHAPDLPALVGLLDDALLADLPRAVDALVAAVQAKAATGADVTGLMAALPPLARVARYGNVRRTDAESVAGVIHGIVSRVCVGLPNAVASLDDPAAGEMFEHVNRTAEALTTLQNEAHLADWHAALRHVAGRESVHGLIGGRAVRLLHDAGKLEPDDVARRTNLALSAAAPAPAAAAWIDGFLRGSGLILVHDAALWSLIDGWLGSLVEDHFTEVLPLLRRTFSTFPTGERRQMGERVGQGPTAAAADVDEDGTYNSARGEKVLPTLALLLGVQRDEKHALP